MPSFGDIELFVALARTRSYTEAAKLIGMPTSTLSRRISQFERALGLQLFVRTTRQVSLTETARQYLSRCELILQAARDAQEELLGLAKNPSGVLRISLEADVGSALVAPAVVEFRGRYPGVVVDLDLSPRRVDLVAEGFDLAVRLGSLPNSSLIVRQIAALEVGLYASPAYLHKRGEPDKPADLLEHARLHLLHEHDSGEWRLRSGRRRAVIERAGAIVSANNMTMMRVLLRKGLGIGLMDDVMGGEDVKAGLLRRVLPEWSVPSVEVSILTPTRLLPAKTREFINIVVECIGKQRGKPQS
jgi:DNA-binding transcriptional LysR family regulator